MSENLPNLPVAIDAWLVANSSKLADLARILGVSKATVTRWRQGEEPEVNRIKEVAKRLGVTVGYLADEADIAHNDAEKELLRKYRKANAGTQKAMQAVGDTADDVRSPPQT